MTERDVTFGERTVGPDQPCYIIAEAGVNHNGSYSMAEELIDVAVQAGADAVKFQTFNPDTVFTRTAAKAEYQKADENDQESAYEMLRRLALPYEDFRRLRDYARERGIAFFSKGHKENIGFLVSLGVPMLKIDSSQLIWYSHLRESAVQGIPIVLSTGTCSLGEVEKALAIINETGNSNVVLLHCTSAYPTPFDQVNLRAMVTLRSAFGLNVGLSDHSLGTEVALAAVALGAVVIEKHFTIDRELPGPDHKASVEPDELSALVRGIRCVEAAMGSPVKHPTELELTNMQVVRRSMVADCDIELGELFTSSNVSFKRPYGGLGEEFMEVVLGRMATRDMKEGDPITWDVVGGVPIG